MAVTIQVRRDASANWVSLNPVLHQGEPGLETDTGRFKYGDGATAWTSLGYASQQLTPTTQTTTYTANPGDLVKANIASSSWTLSLPSAPAANTIVGAKVIANATGNANTLTVACQGSDKFETSTGGTTTTLFLANQAAAWQYNGGYWTRLSDDLPLGQLDQRYQKVFSPITYGAVGNEIANDTAAVQACFAAAAAVDGTVWLGTSQFLCNEPVVLPSNITIAGASSQGASVGLGAIRNNTTHLFDCTAGIINNVTMTNVSLLKGASTGTHIFNMGSGVAGFGALTVRGCNFDQQDAGGCIFYGTSVTWISNYIGYNTLLSASGSATTSPVYIQYSGSAINTNAWENLILGFSHNPNVPFFNIQCTGDAWQASNNFRNLDCEECDAGIILLGGCSYSQIENVQAYDTTTFVGSLFQIVEGTGSGLYCNAITIRNSGSIGGTFDSGCYHVYCPAIYGSLVLENVGGESGSSLYDVPATETVIIGGADNTVVTVPAVSVAGYASSVTSGMRFVGATASGAPGSGTFLAGDVILDQASRTFRECYSGGTPGSWQLMGGTALDSTASDIQPGGTQAAGSEGLGADSKHVHPAWELTAADCGLLAWTLNPAAGQSTRTHPGAGYLWATRFRVAAPGTTHDLNVIVSTAESGLSNSYFGLYNSSGSSLLAQTADISSDLATASVANMTWSTGYALTPGIYYLALVIGTGTGPGFFSGFSNAPGYPSLGMPSGSYVGFYINGSYSALPGSISPTSGTAFPAMLATLS